MMRTFHLIALIALFAAACSPPAAQGAKTGDMNMAEPAATAISGPISGAGTVTEVDAATGAIVINHEPIAALDWPAMTMHFTAESPAILQGIAVGDRVTFELKSAAETSVVTMVRKE